MDSVAFGPHSLVSKGTVGFGVNPEAAGLIPAPVQEILRVGNFGTGIESFQIITKEV